MILEFVINLIIKIASAILWSIRTATPTLDISIYMTGFITKLLTITTQANNMIHFLLGDFCYPLITLTLPLLAYKYLVYPTITFIRSIIASGNN